MEKRGRKEKGGVIGRLAALPSNNGAPRGVVPVRETDQVIKERKSGASKL